MSSRNKLQYEQVTQRKDFNFKHTLESGFWSLCQKLTDGRPGTYDTPEVARSLFVPHVCVLSCENSTTERIN